MSFMYECIPLLGGLNLWEADWSVLDDDGPALVVLFLSTEPNRATKLRERKKNVDCNYLGILPSLRVHGFVCL